MKLNDYQNLSKRTMSHHENPMEKLFAANNYGLGLVEESGEVAGLIKKKYHHGHEIDVDEIKKELGDALHYLAGLATIFGIELEDVATANIEKLRKRYPNGFSVEDSVARKDVE